MKTTLLLAALLSLPALAQASDVPTSEGAPSAPTLADLSTRAAKITAQRTLLTSKRPSLVGPTVLLSVGGSVTLLGLPVYGTLAPILDALARTIFASVLVATGITAVVGAIMLVVDAIQAARVDGQVSTLDMEAKWLKTFGAGVPVGSVVSRF